MICSESEIYDLVCLASTFQLTNTKNVFTGRLLRLSIRIVCPGCGFKLNRVRRFEKGNDPFLLGSYKVHDEAVKKKQTAIFVRLVTSHPRKKYSYHQVTKESRQKPRQT